MDANSKTNCMNNFLGDGDLLFPGAEAVSFISLYLSHRPGAHAESFFEWVKINGVIVQSKLKPIELPGKQGWYVDLAFFDRGRKLLLSWELHTLNIGATSVQANIGIFRNRNLRDRVVLTQNPMDLSSYQIYNGEGHFSV